MSHSVVYCPRASQQGYGNSIQFAYNRYQELNYLNHQHCLPRSKLVRTWSQKAVIQPRYSNMVQGFITARPNVHPYPLSLISPGNVFTLPEMLSYIQLHDLHVECSIFSVLQVSLFYTLLMLYD